MSLEKIVNEFKEEGTSRLTVLIANTLSGGYNTKEPIIMDKIDPEKIKDLDVEGNLGEIYFTYEDVPIHIHVT